MISDVLFDAIQEIDRYLTDPLYARHYDEPAVQAAILRVKQHMDEVRAMFDVPPSPEADRRLAALKCWTRVTSGE